MFWGSYFLELFRTDTGVFWGWLAPSYYSQQTKCILGRLISWDYSEQTNVIWDSTLLKIIQSRQNVSLVVSFLKLFRADKMCFGTASILKLFKATENSDFKKMHKKCFHGETIPHTPWMFKAGVPNGGCPTSHICRCSRTGFGFRYIMDGFCSDRLREQEYIYIYICNHFRYVSLVEFSKREADDM